MPAIRFQKFDRLLSRCDEIGTADIAKPNVALVYKKCLAPASAAFHDAHSDVKTAESSARKQRAATDAMLATFDDTYGQTRAVVLAFESTLVVPETLKSQPTDTDRASAIKDLIKIIMDRTGTDWADDLAKGDFGAQAPAAIEQLGLSSKADTLLATARATRSTLFDQAHPVFMAFKNVVRRAHGQKSHEYRRIHVRYTAGVDQSEEPPVAQDQASAAQTQKAKPAAQTQKAKPAVSKPAPVAPVAPVAPAAYDDSADADDADDDELAGSFATD